MSDNPAASHGTPAASGSAGAARILTTIADKVTALVLAAIVIGAGVLVGSFLIGRYEVSVGEYRVFAEATGYKTRAEIYGRSHAWLPKPVGTWSWERGASWRTPGFIQTDRHPVVHVTWYDAIQYCLFERSSRVRRAGVVYSDRSGGMLLRCPASSWPLILESFPAGSVCLWE